MREDLVAAVETRTERHIRRFLSDLHDPDVTSEILRTMLAKLGATRLESLG